MTAIDLVSPLPRGECVKRLQSNVSSYWAIASANKVVGSIDGDTLRLRKRIYYRNSFQPTLRGRLSDAPGGTRIHCEFRSIPLTPILIAAGVIVVVAIGMVASLLASRHIRFEDIPLVAILIPLGALPLFVGLGFGTIWFGRRLARGDEDMLLDFLRKTLDARQESPSP